MHIEIGILLKIVPYASQTPETHFKVHQPFEINGLNCFSLKVKRSCNWKIPTVASKNNYVYNLQTFNKKGVASSKKHLQTKCCSLFSFFQRGPKFLPYEATQKTELTKLGHRRISVVWPRGGCLDDTHLLLNAWAWMFMAKGAGNTEEQKGKKAWG